ncbi:MAG TPA: GNAT family N-acetyltransferase [Rhodanobacteraceae bacterium]|nr:GNAT family N-acetyltransferase [Rhodanobacteraceae bacterium]
MNASERDALLAIRDNVFVLEQRVPVDLDRDDDDPLSVHVLARAMDGTPIGTGRLAPDGRIGRMAVVSAWRGRGVGTVLLQTLLELARGRKFDSVTAHAQRSAARFYLRHGFKPEGEPFDEAGIPHLHMRRPIEPLAEPERPLLAPARQPLHLQANTREELIAVTQTLLEGARHSMCVLVRELHPILLNDTASLVQLRRLAISGRGASLRMIAQDLSRAFREGTRLLQLAQRLSSVIEMRRPVEPADLSYRSAFMCVDTQGYLFRPVESEMAAVGSTYAPGRHAELMRLFEEVWNRSEPWPEQRELGV